MVMAITWSCARRHMQTDGRTHIYVVCLKYVAYRQSLYPHYVPGSCRNSLHTDHYGVNQNPSVRMDVQLNSSTTAGSGQGGYQEPDTNRLTMFFGCSGDLASGAGASAALGKLGLYGRVTTRKLLLKTGHDGNQGSIATL